MLLPHSSELTLFTCPHLQSTEGFLLFLHIDLMHKTQNGSLHEHTSLQLIMSNSMQPHDGIDLNVMPSCCTKHTHTHPMCIIPSTGALCSCMLPSCRELCCDWKTLSAKSTMIPNQTRQYFIRTMPWNDGISLSQQWDKPFPNDAPVDA